MKSFPWEPEERVDLPEQRYIVHESQDLTRTLVIADLHLGLELEFFEMGITPREGLSEEILNEMLVNIDQEDPDRVIILGDVEHTFRKASRDKGQKKKSAFFRGFAWGERLKTKLVTDLLQQLSGDREVFIVLGNHDFLLRRWKDPTQINVVPPSGMVHNGIGYLHGHAMPKIPLRECSEVIMAHIHPAVSLFDELGVKYTFPVLLMGEGDVFSLENPQRGVKEEEKEKKQVKIQILPAYNPYIVGTPVNEKRDMNRAFPIFKRLLEDFEIDVFLTNGVFLGKLSDLIP